MIRFLLCLCFLSSAISAEDQKIKTRDLKNIEVGDLSQVEAEGAISPEQLAAMKRQVEIIREKQKVSEDILNEMDKE